MAKKQAPKGVTDEKKQKVSEISDLLKHSASVTFVDYSGMGVVAQQELKAKLSEEGGSMMVSKNTLIKLAGAEAGFSDEEFSDEVFSGQTALIASGDDPVSPIQALAKFIDEVDVPQFKAGIVEGEFYNKENIIKISKMPGREQLYANVVGAVAGPMYGLVGTLEANLQKLVFILEQAKEKASTEPASA